MSKNKWYVVWKGRQTGVFSSWEECKAQIDQFQGALYKSFRSESEAKTALTQDPYSFFNSKKSQPLALFDELSTPYSLDSLCVDAACSGNPGKMEYRGIWTTDKTEAFHSQVFPIGTNNLGEFLGIVDAIRYLKKEKKTDTIIYTDSETAMTWVKNKKVKSTLDRTPETKLLWQEVDHALDELNDTPFPFKVLKWNTNEWGEILADFGRK